MNRSFTIDVRGFSEKAEGSLEGMVAEFVASLPARLHMESAAVATPANAATKKPKPAAPAKPAAKGKARGSTRK